MNDPRRLLADDASELEHALLRAGADEQPSDASLAELHRALGLVAPVAAKLEPIAPAPRMAGPQFAGTGTWIAGAVALLGTLMLVAHFSDAPNPISPRVTQRALTEPVAPERASTDAGIVQALSLIHI